MRENVCLNGRDQRILRTAWTLGWVTCAGLIGLGVPTTGPDSLNVRLRHLRRAGYLVQQKVTFSAGGVNAL